MQKDRVKLLQQRLESGRFAPFLQFVKFGLVGVSNTLISYGIEMLCYYALLADNGWNEQMRVIITSILAFVVSVTNSYYWNNRYVFSSGTRKSLASHAIAYGKTVLCYGLTGLLLAPALKLWLGSVGIPYWFASLASLIVTIPLNFVLNKFWAFSK